MRSKDTTKINNRFNEVFRGDRFDNVIQWRQGCENEVKKGKRARNERSINETGRQMITYHQKNIGRKKLAIFDRVVSNKMDYLCAKISY